MHMVTTTGLARRRVPSIGAWQANRAPDRRIGVAAGGRGAIGVQALRTNAHPGAAAVTCTASYFGWSAIERAEMVNASEKHMPSSAPWFFSDGKIASTIFTEPQA